MAAAEERQHVVLAQAVERDVLDEHHLVVVLVEDRAGDDLLGAYPITVGELSKRSRDATRRPLESLPRGVLAELGEKRLDQVGDLVSAGDLRLGHQQTLT